MMSDTDLPAASSGSPFGLAVDDRVYWFSDRHTASWDAVSNTWESLAPAPRPVEDAVWDGSRIISLSARAMYDPLEDEWVPLADSLATIAELEAQLVQVGEKLVAAVGSGDVVSLHRPTADDEWEIVSRVELRGSVHGFDVSSHEGIVYLVNATGMTTRLQLRHRRLVTTSAPASANDPAAFSGEVNVNRADLVRGRSYDSLERPVVAARTGSDWYNLARRRRGRGVGHRSRSDDTEAVQL